MDDRQFKAAMKILEREQQAYLPSPKQLLLFRIYNLAIVLWLVSILGFFVLAVKGGTDSPAYLVLAGAYLLTTIAVPLLFVLNIPLGRKLWRQARLRRHLGLKRDLASVFRRSRWTTRGMLNSVIGGMLVFVAVLLIGASLVGFFEGDWLIAGPLFLIAVSIFSLPLMRRAKARLSTVDHLYATITDAQQAPPEDDQEPRISSSAFQMIAELERSQIIHDRERSLRLGDKTGQLPAYTLQQSRLAHRARFGLDSASARKVEQVIFDLVEDPRPEGITEDPETGLSVVKIPETSLEIGYRVQDEASVIQVVYLEPSADRKPGADSDA